MNRISLTIFYIASLAYFFFQADKNSHSGSDTLIAFALPFIIISIFYSLATRKHD